MNGRIETRVNRIMIVFGTGHLQVLVHGLTKHVKISLN